MGDELQEGVEFLQNEMKVKSKRHRIDEQNRLYELTVRQVMPQLETIKARLAVAKQANETEKKRLLHEINLLGTYIKRRSNLILMAEGKEAVNISDLSRCFEESFESLRQGEAHCSLIATTLGEINHDAAILLYDFFQAVLEGGFSTLRCMFVTLEEQGKDLTLLIEIECSESLSDFPDNFWRVDQITALGGQILRHESKKGGFSFTLRLPKGGVNR